MALPSHQDQASISALANTYTDAVNTRDWARYRSCWTEDAVWELGAPVNQKKVGIEAIMAEVKRAVGAMDLFVQMNHATTILSIDGDTAVIGCLSPGKPGPYSMQNHNNRRNSMPSTRTGRRKAGRDETQRVPSSEMPPPGTIMWI